MKVRVFQPGGTHLRPATTPLVTPENPTDTVQLDAGTGSAPAPSSEPDWDPTTRYAAVVQRHAGGRVELDGVRWGLEELGKSKKTWQPRFPRTTLDTSAVKDVYFARSPFNNNTMGHALLVFEFDDQHPMTNANGETDNRLVLSIEAKMKEGERWEAGRGFKGEYPIVYQLGSFVDGVQRACRRHGTGMQMYRLKLDDGQKEQLLKNTLDASLLTPDKPYHTTRNSCYSNILQLLNSVLPEHQQVPIRSEWTAWLLQKPTSTNAMLSGAALKSRDLLVDEPSIFIHNNTERYPDAKVEATSTEKFLGSVSQSWAWRPGMRLAGAGVGGGLGYLIGGMVPASWGGPIVPTVLGTLLGDRVARIAADEISASTNVDYVSPDGWYRPYLAGSPQVAATEDLSKVEPPPLPESEPAC